MMMYSVTDVQGLNAISRQILANGAQAMAGMVKARLAATREARGRARRGRAAGDRAHDVRRHHALRAAAHRGARRRVRLPRVPCDRRRRPVDGEAGRRRPARRRDRHHHHRGLRPDDGRRVSGRPRTASARSSARACPMSARSARSTWSTSARATPCRSATAAALLHQHNPQVTLMRTTPDENERMGRWIGERLNQMDAPVRFLLPEGGVSALDKAGRRVLRPGRRRRAVPRARTDRAADLDAPARARAGAHQRSGVRGGGRSTPFARCMAGAPCAAGRRGSHALRTLSPDGEIPRHGGARRADRRRRRRHGPLGEMRGGRRHRPDRDLQFRPLPHGRTRLARRADGLRRRQRHRDGDGRARCCRS